MISSGAFSSLLLCVGLAVFIFAASIKRSKLHSRIDIVDVRIVIICVGALIALVVAIPVVLGDEASSYFVSRFENVYINARALLLRDYSHLTGSSDSMPRLISIVEAAYLFVQYPVFGVGYGTVNPFSTLFGTLATIGVVGLSIWLAIIVNYSCSLCGKGAGILAVALFLFLGTFNGDSGLLYSPVWILLCGLLWDRGTDDAEIKITCEISDSRLT